MSDCGLTDKWNIEPGRFEVIGNVLSESGAFWWSPEHNDGICGARCPESGGVSNSNGVDATTEGNFLVKEFLATPKLPLHFYLAAGTFEIEVRTGWRHSGNDAASARRVAGERIPCSLPAIRRRSRRFELARHAG